MPRFLNPCADSIGYVHFTWNPVTGCEHGPDVCSCSNICWARTMAKRFGKTEDEKNFKPTFHPERLAARFDLIPPSNIFVCDMGDLFGDWVPKEWINEVIKTALENGKHLFLFLTKNPDRYNNYLFPSNCWIGTSITNPSELYRIEQLHGGPFSNYGYKEKHFVSFEPLLEKISYDDLARHNWGNIHWAIIGGFSGNRKQSNPDCYPEIYALYLKRFFEKFKIPVFIKDNLNFKNPLKQFPEGLKI